MRRRFHAWSVGGALALIVMLSGAYPGLATHDVPFYARNALQPNVLIILDRSGSMNDQAGCVGYCGGDGVWCASSTADEDGDTIRDLWDATPGCATENKMSIAVRVLADLLDDNNNYIVDNTLDPDGLGLRLGYSRFVGVSNSAMGAGETTSPYYNTGSIQVVSPAGSTYSSIFSAFNSSTASFYTPLGTSLSEARAYFLNDNSITGDSAKACRRSYVIFVTDGMDTVTCQNNDPDGLNLQNRRSSSYAAYQLRTTNTPFDEVLYGNGVEPGIPVYVVGLGNLPAGGQNLLNWVAFHGGTDNPLVTNAGTTGAVPVPTGLCTDGPDPYGNNLSGYAFFATSSSDLTQALKAAIAQIKQGSYTRSKPVISQNAGRLYLGYFDLPYWKGHLQAFAVDASGNVGTTAVYDAGQTGPPFPGSPKGRGTVYTANISNAAQCTPQSNATPIAFTPTTAALTTSGCATALHGGIDINGSGGAANADDARAVINFTLDPLYTDGAPNKYVGQRALDGWKMGDIYHSTPVPVGPPNQFYVFDNYSTFRDTWKDRETVLYVGANDGMLHAVAAGKATYNFTSKTWTYTGETGSEKWAYVPNAALGKLRDLRVDHTYLVDASPAAADVYIDTPLCPSSPCWRTVLISGLRDGGKKYVALDVTDTNSPKVLWEKGNGDTGYSQMENTWSRPAIGRLKCTGGSGCFGSPTEKYRWVAFVGGGVPASGTAKVYAINISDGSIVASGDIPNLTGASDPQNITNGVVGRIRAMGKAYGQVDTVYFGDLEGKLWRWDVSEENTNQWVLSVLYDPFGPLGAANRRPIYNAPSVALAVTTSGSFYYIAFGTGNESDSEQGPTTVQNYFFFVRDPNQLKTPSPVAGELKWRIGDSSTTTSNLVIAIDGGRTDDFLSVGEKNIGDPVIYYGYVYFTTYLPNTTDPCSIGTSYLWKVSLVENQSGVYEGETQTVGSGLPSGPVIIQSAEGEAQIVVATSAGGQEGKDLIKQMGPAIASPPKVPVESWREVY